MDNRLSICVRHYNLLIALRRAFVDTKKEVADKPPILNVAGSVLSIPLLETSFLLFSTLRSLQN